MTKTQLIDLFGTQSEVARLIGITRASVCQWPEQIPVRLANEIVGASLKAKRLQYASIVQAWPEYMDSE